MRQRLKRTGLIAAAVALLMLLAVGVNTGRQWAGWTGASDTAAERRAALLPYWQLTPPPAGVAEIGGAVLLSGCDGVHDNMDFWAGRLASHGYLALVLDSHSPRGLDRLEAWRLVCAGQALPGAERAGDVAVALADPVLPPGRRVVLGASHGGWAAMEFLRQAVTGQPSPALQSWPATHPRLLASLDAVILLYPYCGLLNGADQGDWTRAPPILMLLAAEDQIISTPACEDLADRLRRRGARITVTLLADADHGFDQNERSSLSPLSFDPEMRERASGLVDDFLASSE
ncbi:dienelactone hydrolase [Paracoccus suum]|uniref:Dienelactone hydrolase n=1 Tax=Paracoccus suum TaxID=2259340 RepID=A0A344PLG5_9RHOB|nr:dienelactone hydrolase family protein [Paracoccus suum]AXC50220.1 dienelactone hydrolase [Paracoccus suum]